MPKLIDYPRTSYAGAWELSEVVDDTGGKCAIDTAARKLDRKVSGSFKAIIGSAVKFGLMTSKRELLSTTTLFRRIKHAYDKKEELLFHREAFLTPPLFTQLCRKFRSRELPVQMLDVMLIREFGVEEINSQGVAKAFIEGARMVGLLDDQNVVADIDQLAAQQPPRRELANPQPAMNTFRAASSNEELELAPTQTTASASRISSSQNPPTPIPAAANNATGNTLSRTLPTPAPRPITPSSPPVNTNADPIANLFGLNVAGDGAEQSGEATSVRTGSTDSKPTAPTASANKLTSPQSEQTYQNKQQQPLAAIATTGNGFQIHISGPGMDTMLTVTDTDDLTLVQALLEKIRRQLRG